MYVCRADYLALDNQVVTLSWGKHFCSQRSLGVRNSCVKFRPHGLFPIHVTMLVFFFLSSLSSCLDSHVSETLCVKLPLFLGDMISQQILFFWFLSLSAPFHWYRLCSVLSQIQGRWRFDT